MRQQQKGFRLRGLTFKLVISVAVPFIAYLTAATMRIVETYHRSTRAAEALLVLETISQSSRVITELQKERGKSSAYLSGAMDFSAVETQRTLSHAELEKFREKLASAPIEKSLKTKIEAAIGGRTGLLSVVDSKGPKATVVGGYTKMIADLLRFQVETKDSIDAVDALMRVSLLENSKEYAGQLRANLTPILAEDKAIEPETLQRLMNLKAGVDIALEAPALSTSPETSKHIQEFKANPDWGTVNEIFNAVTLHWRDGNFHRNSGEFFEIVTRVIDGLNKGVESEFTRAHHETERILAESRSTLVTTSITVCVVTLLIIVAVYYAARSIMGPINGIIAELTSGASGVRDSSQSLTTASQQVASSSTEAAASLEETVASLEQMSAGIGMSSSRAKEASEVAKNSAESAHRGEEDIQKLIEAMKKIAAGSKKIEEITNVIDDIAFQTNLLALNAAVEAARAGDQGRGFAVVADAVRELAIRCSAAARDITSLIDENVVGTQLGAQLADSSGVALQRIVNDASRVASLIDEMAMNNQEQANGVSQITKAMNHLDQATQSNASTAQEVSSSAQGLSQQAELMQTLVERLVSVVHGVSSVEHDASGAKNVIYMDERRYAA